MTSYSGPRMPEPSALRAAAPRSPVGASVGRVDARLKCRGQAAYLGDITLPGMLHAKVLRSPAAHARIVSVDSGGAAAVPGVVRVVTAADLPIADMRYGHLLRDQYILADGIVRYVGEPVAIVIAATESAAAAAVGRLEVEYDELPLVHLSSALRPGAPLIHPEPVVTGYLRSRNVSPRVDGNTCYEYADVRGEPEAVLAGADIVVEGAYTFPSAYQYSMEPHGVIAHRVGGGLDLWSSCQHPFLVRRQLAQLFELDMGDVRLHVPLVGGGFGSKSYTNIEPLACLAAWLADAPVRLVNTVEESMQTSRQHNMTCTMLTAATARGELLLRRAEILMDTGAYATNGPTVTFMTGVAAPGPYSWAAVDVAARCVYTNRPPAGSYRGFGSSHTQWVSELQLDEVAERAGLDRFDLRRRNLLRRGDIVHPKMKPLDADLEQAFDKVVRALPRTPAAPPGRRVGVGVGFGVVPGGADPVGNAIVRLRSDGRVRIMVGTTEIGQGARTVFAQIAASVLCVPIEAIEMPGTDTGMTPYDRSTGASRSTTLVGLAVERASRDAVAQLSGIAARVTGFAAEAVTYADGYFLCDAGRVSLEEVLRSLGDTGDEIIGRGRVGGKDDSTDFPIYWEVCCSGAVVSVDEATGEATVHATVGVPDVGKAINPQLVAIQESGCTVQALGHTLFEALEFGDDGELLTPSLVQYHVPLAPDVPQVMSCELVENGDGPGPFGAKGCGEGAFGAVPAALMTALREAGADVHDLPATPQRIWESMHPDSAGGPPVGRGGLR